MIAPAGALAIAGAGGFVVVVTALHLLKPDLQPSRRFVSEYAIGEHGWLMQAAFGLLTLACAALAVGSWSETEAGAILFMVAALGAAGAGVFVTDPSADGPSHPSRHGLLHVAFSFIVIPVLPVAATVVGIGLWASAAAPAWLGWSAAATWLGLAAFIGGPRLAQAAGLAPDGPPDGGFQRVMILTYAGWLMAAGFVVLAH